MTTEHPITPTPELVRQWVEEAATAPVTEQLTTPRYIATQAARWGADQELDACCEWFIRDWTDIETAMKLAPPAAPSRRA